MVGTLSATKCTMTDRMNVPTFFQQETFVTTNEQKYLPSCANTALDTLMQTGGKVTRVKFLNDEINKKKQQNENPD